MIPTPCINQGKMLLKNDFTRMSRQFFQRTFTALHPSLSLCLVLLLVVPPILRGNGANSPYVFEPDKAECDCTCWDGVYKGGYPRGFNSITFISDLITLTILFILFTCMC